MAVRREEETTRTQLLGGSGNPPGDASSLRQAITGGTFKSYTSAISGHKSSRARSPTCPFELLAPPARVYLYRCPDGPSILGSKKG